MKGLAVLEVGAADVNGGVRSVVSALLPARYVGVDLHLGPGVDVVCDAGELTAYFGEQSFDVVISTEMLEHVEDWRLVVTNLKRVLRPRGYLLVTTRSIGFPYHGNPYDYWRFEPSDMREIFGDMDILALERDADIEPGVLMLARKPGEHVESNLDEIMLYSIVRGRRLRDLSRLQVAVTESATVLWRLSKRVLPRRWIDSLRGWIKEKR